MSTNFTGVTFAKQKVTPSYDGIVRRTLLTDGTLTGCEMSYSGSTLTMAAGQLMICGRQIVHPSSQNWAVTEQTTGYARLVITIDLARTSTKDNFDQVVDTIQYATSVDGFTSLEQSDINTTGTKYQVAACVVSLGTGGITGIVSKLEKCEGGGAGLNFKVVGGTTAPGSPTENTIWVNTSVAIPSWVFSATEPESPVAGMVWISTGTSSSASFNALKKNTLEVYPQSASQYVGGQWVNKNAKICQNGLWVELLTGYLYYHGNLCTHNGGEWMTAAVAFSSDAPSARAPGFTNGADSATITQTGANGGILHKASKIDLTNASQIVLTANKPDTFTNHQMRLSVWSALPTTGQYWANNRVADTSFGSQQGEISVPLDVSALTGEYYVGICVYGARTLEMYAMQVVE